MPKKKPKPKKKPPPVVKPPPAPKPLRKGPVLIKTPKPKLTTEQEQALVRMKWRRRLALDTVKGTAAAKEAEDMAKWVKDEDGNMRFEGLEGAALAPVIMPPIIASSSSSNSTKNVAKHRSILNIRSRKATFEWNDLLAINHFQSLSNFLA